MRNLRLVIEYDGSDFVGWQRQHNGPSVQAALELAIERLTGATSATRAAGRTDAGVHALGQVVTFRTASGLPLHTVLRGLNAHLPPSVAVREVSAAAEDFDARHSASGKLYRYHLWNTVARSPLRARTHWHLRYPLDVPLMNAAAALLIGRHDFRAFRAADCERRTTERLMRLVRVLQPEPAEPQVLHIEVEATAFLKNMVRIIVGTLVDVGRGKRLPEHVQHLLRCGDRTQAGPTAPAHGLHLCRVDYGPRTGV